MGRTIVLETTPGWDPVWMFGVAGPARLITGVGLLNTMPVEIESVREFLIAMSPVREALGDFIRALYRRPEVKLANIYHPSAYVTSDFGISVDLKNGAVVDFWIELQGKDQHWEIIYYVARHDPEEDGSHTETDFPVRNITYASELPSAILAAINELRRASERDALFR